MNKVIKGNLAYNVSNFPEEIAHWLGEGNLWSGRHHPSTGWHWSKHDFHHKGDAIDWTTSKKYLVIDDEYVEFRKASAEGKILQANQSYDELEGQAPRWEAISPSEMTEYCVDFLRIKPEEPKFKEGDWVTQANSDPFQFVDNTCYLGLAHWRPTEGEWVVYTATRYKQEFLVAKKTPQMSEAHCQPFIGTLPKGFN